MDKPFEYVDKFNEYFLKNVEGYDDLKVYKFQDFDLPWLKRLLKFGQENFGENAFDAFSIVFQIYYGNVFILQEGEKKKIEGVAALSRAWDEDDLAYLSDFAISEEARGKSIGSQFLQLVLENLKDQGFKRVRLTVDPENIGAVKLYENSGFEIIETVEKLYDAYSDRHIMEKIF